MGKSGAIFVEVIVVSVHNFSWVDLYSNCGCTIS